MESMRKRKGAKSSPPSAAAGRKRVLCGDDLVRQSRKKKCTGEAKPGREETGSCSVGTGCAAAAVMTAPACGPSSCGEPGRGLKRKLGCVESATRVGRKKKLESEYVLGREIGQGKFGSVRLCRSRTTKEEYACKKLLKNGEETVHKEVEIMQHLSGHPGVVTLREVFEDSDCFYLVMELCSGGRLLDRIAEEERFSEHKAANMLKELVSVIKYCHDMGVIHRDIKPENILLTSSGKMKLADFGLAARVANGQRLAGVAGTPAYVAPEVLSGNYSEKADIWSAGVLLHLLLVGVLPFQGPSREAVFEAVKSVDLNFHSGVWGSISELARSLLGQMLTRDVSSRMTADEVLVHPWILFYTECSSKVIYTKNLSGSCTASAEEVEIIPSMQLKRVRSAFESFTNYSNVSSEDSNQKPEDSGDGHFVDALAVAINRVTISEPKRSRLCATATPIKQEHSSNMKANLLAAF